MVFRQKDASGTTSLRPVLGSTIENGNLDNELWVDGMKFCARYFEVFMYHGWYQ